MSDTIVIVTSVSKTAVFLHKYLLFYYRVITNKLRMSANHAVSY